MPINDIAFTLFLFSLLPFFLWCFLSFYPFLVMKQLRGTLVKEMLKLWCTVLGLWLRCFELN